MKRFRTLMILLLMASAGMQSCYKDILSPGADPNGPPQQVSFSGDILPILTKNCALSGCHDAAGTEHPTLTVDKAYGELINGGFVNTIAPNASTFYTVITGGACLRVELSNLPTCKRSWTGYATELPTTN